MALNWNEKFKLDEVLVEFIVHNLSNHTNVLAKSITKEVQNKVDFTITSASITASFNRIKDRLQREYNIKIVTNYADFRNAQKQNTYNFIVNKYSLMRSNGNESIFRKEKNLLILGESLNKEENNHYFTYNFITGEFSDDVKYLTIMLEPCLNSLNTEIFIEMLGCEWIFNYTKYFYDIVQCYRIFEEFSLGKNISMPKGFFEYLNNSPLDITAFLVVPTILREYILISKYGKIGCNLCEYEIINRYQLEWLVENDLLNNFIKVVVSSSKQGLIPTRRELNVLIANWIDIRKISEFSNYTLDVNKDFLKNTLMLENMLDEFGKYLINTQMQRLNFVNNYNNDNLQVVVPQSVEDKKAEGEMQKNCVGYYYDSSIKKGENFIFFIRKKDNLSKSYVTCRFNIHSKCVVEFREKNNNTVKSQETIKFIREVEKIIVENIELLK